GGSIPIATSTMWSRPSSRSGNGGQTFPAIVLSSKLRSCDTSRPSSSRSGAERFLELLRRLEVTLKSRSHLLHERLELSILDRGNQRPVERVDHRLMVGHFVGSIGLVEIGSGLAPQRLHLLLV